LPLGAAVYLPAHAVDTPFGTGRTTGLSPSGSKVVLWHSLDWGRPGGAVVYLPTAITEVHDVLLEATVQAVLGECPTRKRGDPGWFVEAKSTHCFR
jgi:hypothetical protein